MTVDGETPTPAAEPSAEELEALEALEAEMAGILGRAYSDAVDVMEPGRIDVLQRVSQQVDAEGARIHRRNRRRALRALFYLFNLAAVVLIVIAYMGNHMAIQVMRLNAQRLATRTELTALTRALVRYAQDHPQAELPGDEGALWEALEAGYYPFSPQRRREGEYLDDFGQPYRFRSQPGRALIYSVGPNGKDDGGEGDDVRDQWVTFVR